MAGNNSELDGRAITALMLLSLRSVDEDSQVDVLLKAGYTNVEIADLCGISAGAVGMRKLRAKAKPKQQKNEKEKTKGGKKK